MKAKKEKSSISTLKLMSFIEKESGIFDQDHHQDCHEFYIWLMDRINEEIKEKSKEKTKLEHEFFSTRVTRTQCEKCKKSHFFFRVDSEREEEEVDLSLILPEPNVSLNYCIDSYSNS